MIPCHSRFRIQEYGLYHFPVSSSEIEPERYAHNWIIIVHHGRMPPSRASPFTKIPNATTSVTTLSGTERPSVEADITRPYLCYAFKVDDTVVYMSDVSHIPDDKWAIIEPQGKSGQLGVLVLDCLRLLPQISHIGIEYAVETARRVKASRTYLIGMGHEVMHDEYVTIGEVVGGAVRDEEELSEITKRGVGLIKKGEEIWVRPGHDGLRVLVERDSGFVWDETY